MLLRTPVASVRRPLLDRSGRIHATKVTTMTRPAHLDKSDLVALLRSKGLHARADWVDRNLPDVVDTDRNAALLQMLDIDPAAVVTTPIHDG